MSEKKSFTDRVESLANAIAGPIGKFAELPPIAAIQNGLVGAMPVIMIGSIFLVFFVLATPSVGSGETPLLPFLAPLAGQFVWMKQATMDLMSLYCAVSIAQSYAQIKKVDMKSASILGLASFILITVNGFDELGGILVSNWSASGLFVCMFVSILCVKIYSIFIEKGFTIKMPDSVPPSVGNSFASMVPYAVCFTVCWIIRCCLNIDLVSCIMNVLTPLVSGIENGVFIVVEEFFQTLLWSVGLHGDNMLGNLFSSFGLIWQEENAAALAAGTATYELPHILAGFPNGLARMMIWPACVWPVVILLLRSKVKHHRALGVTVLAPSIFTIVEPIIFGLPLCLNPTLMIPFILSATVSMAVGYFLTYIGLFGRFFASVPWATPPFLQGPLGTGDIKTALLPFIALAIGFVIYLPFWRIYEKKCLELEKANEAENAAE